jgi:pimeloyl-ACP methyl ester carboxylesterase
VSCGAPGDLPGHGVRLRAHRWPNAARPRVILLHSLAAHGHWWDWVAPHLAERFDVVALDFRGHGGSGRDATGAYGFADHALDVLAACDALGGAAPVVVGHSMGGYVAAWLAAHHPDRVAGVVITDILTAWPPELARFARQQAERESPRFATPAAAAERYRLSPSDSTAPADRVRHLGETGVRQDGLGTWTYAFDRRVFLHPPVDPWPFLPRIACPALVVHGEHSSVMDADTGRRVAAAIPRGQAATLPGTRHHLVVEDPEGFRTLVLDWLRAMIAA